MSAIICGCRSLSAASCREVETKGPESAEYLKPGNKFFTQKTEDGIISATDSLINLPRLPSA